MVEYKRKKIQLQSGGTRYYYYKVLSDGKKERISKEKYLEHSKKRGGNDGNTTFQVKKKQNKVLGVFDKKNTDKTLTVTKYGQYKYGNRNVDEIGVGNDKKLTLKINGNANPREVYFENDEKFQEFKNLKSKRNKEIQERRNKRNKEIQERENRKTETEKVKQILIDGNRESFNFKDYWERFKNINVNLINFNEINKLFNSNRYKWEQAKKWINIIIKIKEAEQKVKNTEDLDEIKQVAETIQNYNNFLMAIYGYKDVDKIHETNVDLTFLCAYYLLKLFKKDNKDLLDKLLANGIQYVNERFKTGKNNDKIVAFALKDAYSNQGSTHRFYRYRNIDFKNIGESNVYGTD